MKYDYKTEIKKDILKWINQKGGVSNWNYDYDHMDEGFENNFCNEEEYPTFHHESEVKKEWITENFDMWIDAITEDTEGYGGDDADVIMQYEDLIIKLAERDWGYFDYLIRITFCDEVWAEIMNELEENGAFDQDYEDEEEINSSDENLIPISNAKVEISFVPRKIFDEI